MDLWFLNMPAGILRVSKKGGDISTIKQKSHCFTMKFVFQLTMGKGFSTGLLIILFFASEFRLSFNIGVRAYHPYSIYIDSTNTT